MTRVAQETFQAPEGPEGAFGGAALGCRREFLAQLGGSLLAGLALVTAGASSIDCVGRSDKRLPDFEVQNRYGRSFRIAQLRAGSELVLVDFWASWCVPCMVNNYAIEGVFNLYRSDTKFVDHDGRVLGEGLKIISVSVDEDRKLWEKALNDCRSPWPGQFLADQGILSKLGEDRIPLMFLVAQDGRVIATLRSPDELLNAMAEYSKPPKVG